MYETNPDQHRYKLFNINLTWIILHILIQNSALINYH